MSPFILNQVADIGIPEPGWKNLYKAGGAAALLAVSAFLLDILIAFGGEDFNPGSLTAIEWFKLFQGNGLFGLRALGLINILSLTVSIALYFALYAVLRKGYKTCAALGLILYFMGTAIYISNNAAVPMLVLSDKYAAATTNAQKMLLAAAGEAVLARGADFTPGSFIGFFFTEIAGITFSWMMLRSSMFGKAAAFAGISGFVLLSVFTIWSTFVPVFFDAAMIVAMVGGLLSITWYTLVARRLFQIGQSTSKPEAYQNTSLMLGNR